ncbi:MAG: hypothetical protein KF690_01160 [Bacteroidetes bacterium]|nr:hypothetical protein [Bacteroidota bacterium]
MAIDDLTIEKAIAQNKDAGQPPSPNSGYSTLLSHPGTPVDNLQSCTCNPQTDTLYAARAHVAYTGKNALSLLH